MTICFEPNIDDVIAFHRDYYSACPVLARRARGIRLTYFAVVAVWILMLVMLYNNGVVNSTTIVLGVCSVIWLLLGIFTKRRLISASLKQVRQMYGQHGTSSYFTPVEMTFDESGISTLKTSVKSHTAWEGVVRWSETDGYFFIYHTPLEAFTVPKSKLSADEITELEYLLGKHVKQ